MKPQVALWLLATPLLLSPKLAQARACATLSMTVTSPGTIVYAPASVTDKSYAASATVTCNRTPGGGANDTVTVRPGTATGILTTTAPAAPTIAFHLNKNATVPCASGTKWTNGAPFTLTFPNAPSPNLPQTVTFYVCVPSGQAGLLPPEGNYTQNQNLTANRGGQTATANLATTIFAPASCTFQTTPGTINFSTYTAFGPAKTANTSFNMRCSTGLSHSLSVGPVADGGGVVGGGSLRYTLGITVTAPGVGTNPLTLVGDGSAKTYYINGTMPAGQAGTCAAATCANQTDARTLTVTY
jgi:hypothetical protein